MQLKLFLDSRQVQQSFVFNSSFPLRKTLTTEWGMSVCAYEMKHVYFAMFKMSKTQKLLK